ncbi:iron ABC transporter permease [Caballeronia sp. ATUFL_M1_KS5A]|uniref:ABC transporter permease n=1 Tax=Caballeronia sp. ATUFL_M1_KS5A TaxID=2921778 RepID=UPI0020281550|nr:iron ABC transporter permease [Caballeronia sp. ATUFL_M1_KS5A]
MQSSQASQEPAAVGRHEIRRWNGLGIVAGIVLAGVAFLIVYPMLRMAGAVMGGESIAPHFGIDPSIWQVFWNTFVVVGGSSLIALAFGTALALINERTDGGFRGVGNFMPIAPLMLPSITGVLGWVVLFDPRVGLVNVALRSIFGWGAVSGEGPLNIYTMSGLIFAMSIHMVPTIYLVVSAALRNLDPSIEEASRTFGSGPLGTALRVTVPAIRPALFEAWLLAIISGISIFAVPVIIGTGAQIEVISVRIWRYLTAYPSNQSAALVLALAMLLMVIGLRYAKRFFAPAGRHAVVGGRGVRSAPTQLGRLRHVTRAIIVFYIALALVLPLLALMVVSVEHFWTAHIPWRHLTFDNYVNVATRNPATSRALINSLLLAGLSATITTIVAGFLMIYVHQLGPAGRGGKRSREQAAGSGRKRSREWGGRVRGMVDFVTTLPTTIPHSLIGVAFIVAFSAAPFDLYGTIWIVLLALLVMDLPYAAASARAATDAIGHELTEASRIFRATPAGTMRRILLPLVLPGLATGWVLVFVRAFGEVTASAILSGTSNPVVGAVLLDLWRQGSFPMMTAFALIIWFIGSLLVLAMLWFNNRRLAKVK